MDLRTLRIASQDFRIRITVRPGVKYVDFIRDLTVNGCQRSRTDVLEEKRSTGLVQMFAKKENKAANLYP